jgi:DDE family transposase
VQTEEAARVTAWSGLPLLVEVMQVFGVAESIRKHVKVFGEGRQFDEVSIITALVLLVVAGGEYLDDLRIFKRDEALGRLLGFELPSPETARQFLYEFHEDRLLEEAEGRLPPNRKAFVPEENEGLRGLGLVVRDLNAHIQRRWPVKEATLDFDSTFQASNKREAKEHYEGGPGYQPMLATWVEQRVIVYDEFRDGNVAPHHDALGVVQKGFAAVPSGIEKRMMRGDSAMYSLPLLRWLCSENIEFAIGAHVREGFREQCKALPEEAWAHLDSRPDSTLHIAELDYVPKDWTKKDPTLRFLAIRMSPIQNALFDEERRTRFLGVVTNRQLEASELVRWYWAKGGTIEHVHDVLKNDLGAGVFPCGRFGANAAWLRVCVLAHNLLRVVKTIGPKELADAKPKRLRLHLFAVPALLKTQARRLLACVTNFTTGLATTRDALWGLVALEPA